MARIDDEVEELRTAVAVLQTQHNALAERFDAHERKQNGSLDKIWAELKEITKAVTAASQQKGPTWGVTFALGIMSSLVVGLAVALIRG